MIQPSEICISDLPSLPLNRKNELPKHPGIYFAIDSTGAQELTVSSGIRRFNQAASNSKHRRHMAISAERLAELERQAQEYNDKAEALQRETEKAFEEAKAEALREFQERQQAQRQSP
jgi:hypothetical protein